MSNPNDLNYSDLNPETPANPLPPPPNPGRPSDAMYIPSMSGPPLPEKADGTWHIELYYNPILHRGHAYPVLVDPQGRVREELHGLAFDKNTGNEMSVGRDGDRLVALRWQNPNYMADDNDHKGHYMGDGQQQIGTAAEGNYKDIVEGLWKRAMNAADQTNQKDFDYKGDDPAFELGSESSGQIQNSNSVADTLGRAMGLNFGHHIEQQGWQDKFPGWGRNLLDPKYRPYRYPVTAVEDPSLRQGNSP